jgi:hypothetical protein
MPWRIIQTFAVVAFQMYQKNAFQLRCHHSQGNPQKARLYGTKRQLL